VLTTHVNADGDGTGSEVAAACWLAAIGAEPAIVNPTPFPAAFSFLLQAKGAESVRVADVGTPDAEAALSEADVVLVLDTGEPARIGKVARALSSAEVLVIDHHPLGPDPIRASADVRDPSACATGELIYDLLALDRSYRSWPTAVTQALYTAIATDTGSFRFSNTTPRTHEIVGDLIRRVDPEEMYGRLDAVPFKRTLLLREALETLHYDPDSRIASITIPEGTMERLGVGPEDLDGIIEHARSIEGTEVALLFRQTGGSTKVSLRSNGATDVNAIARTFGGGGHVKAAGALIGGPMERNRSRVVEAVTEAVRRS
jgi:phosphoesterase RecJ-like protein